MPTKPAALVPVSWPRMIRAVEKVRDRMLRAAKALEHANIPYAVVGGNAVAAWVSRVDETVVRNTRDVDILLRRADLPEARAALEAVGFIYRRVSSLGRPGTLDIFLDGPDARAGDALHLVFAAEKVRDDSPAAAPDVSESEQADQFRVVTLDALVRMKLSAFRDKDRVHLRDFLEVGLIDATWPGKLEPELGRRLQKLIETPEG